jgi:hypothetical protein
VWLIESHFVFFLMDLTADLDLVAIHTTYRHKDTRVEKVSEPRTLVILLL